LAIKALVVIMEFCQDILSYIGVDIEHFQFQNTFIKYKREELFNRFTYTLTGACNFGSFSLYTILLL
jgi:hypothetical protein